MLELLLIRHGQTDWNKERRIMGHRPISLNRLGREQARQTARILKEVALDAVYVSPMLRAIETAQILVKGRGIPLELAPALAEINYGEWVGKTFDEVSAEKQFHVYYTKPRHACPPGGETLVCVKNRIIDLIEELRKNYEKGRIALVSHADVIKVVLVHYLGLDLNDITRFRIDNGSVSLLSMSKKQQRVLTMNYSPMPDLLFSISDHLPTPLGLPSSKPKGKRKK